MSLLELALTNLITLALALENRKLVYNTIARFVMFDRYWRKGLKRKVFNKAKHNVQTNVYYDTLESSPMQMIKILALLEVLKQMKTNINSFLEDVDAIILTNLEIVIDALLSNQMFQKNLILTYDHIWINVFKNKITSFANKMYYPQFQVK